jgi:vacuolar protein sorting-associated protein 45
MTQHKPVLLETLDLLKRNKLPSEAFDTEVPKGVDAPKDGKASSEPREVIVFILGGVTYEESMTVAELNKAGPMKVVLGGTSVLNSASFISEIESMSKPAPEESDLFGGKSHGASGSHYTSL